MDNLNNIPNAGNWGDAASKLNDNFNKVKQAVTTVENTSKNNKGYFTSLSALNTAFPSPKAGQTAYVYDEASSTNYYIYNAVNGAWVASSIEAPSVGVDIAEYTKTGGSTKTTKDIDDIKANHGYDSSPKTLKEVDDDLVQLAGDVSAISGNFERSKQLFDKQNDILRVGYQLPSGANTASDHNIVVTIPRNRIPSDTFTIQTRIPSSANQSRVVYLQGSTILSTVIGDGVSKTTTHVIPENCDTIKIHAGYLTNVVSLPLRDNDIVNTFVLNDGAIAFPHDEYNKYTLKEESIPEYIEALEVINKLEPVSDDLVTLVNKDILITAPGKNLLNEALIDFTKRYSPASNSIVNSQNTIYIGTPYIKVKGGEFYTFNAGNFNGGGYFENIGDTNAVSGIITGKPVDNIGYLFQVPMEYDGYYVVVNLLRTDSTGTTLVQDYQIEHGEQVTSYEPYEEVEQFNPEYLINNDVPSTPIPTDTLLDKLTDVNSITKIEHEKLPLFFKHCRLKDKDINVVNSGTSLFARTNEHCTFHSKANERPPLFHSMNAATHIWDAIKWDSQFYRRYDYPDFFTETGSFATTSNLPEWDDNTYRAGFTRYSNSAGASIGFQIPINAWQFNFIYRTDSQASENIVLTIAQGDNHVEVFNGTDWVEANGFSFSQLQVEAFLSDVDIPDARTGTSQVIASYKIGGNTTYQKRLKMRCKSATIDTRSIVKDVTIVNNSTGRLMYWGVEWSVREHMITMINAARGSHNISIVGPNSTHSLSHYQDNEVWGFEPDLILTENPIHNSGTAKEPSATYPTNYWGDVTNDFFFGDNPVSMKSRATVHGLDPEYLIFTSSIAWNFGGINDDGTLKVGTDKDGKQYTALESFSMAHQYLVDNHPNVLAINSVNYWVKSGFDVYGDLRTATEGSGKDGLTFTNEGSHWNDTGSKIIAKTILPMLKFY